MTNPVLAHRKQIATELRWLVNAFPRPPVGITVPALANATGRPLREVTAGIAVLHRNDFIARGYRPWRQWQVPSVWYLVNPYFL